MPRPRSPLMALALLMPLSLGAVPPDALETRPDPGIVTAGSKMQLVIATGKATTMVAEGPAGLEEADALLREALGSRYPSSRCKLVLDALRDPIFYTKLDFAVSVAGDVTFQIEIHPNDSLDELFVGESLSRRGRLPYRVVGGDTLGELAQRWGTDIDSIKEMNPNRFEIWPHRERPDCVAGVDPRTMKQIIRFGESQMIDMGWGASNVRYVLLHEAGHVGDASCCGDRETYGPDEAHYLDEVITPASAFQEAWGNYRGVHSHAEDPRLARWDDYDSMEQAVHSLDHFYPALRFEVREDDYVAIPCMDLTLHDLLASELVVARFLWALHKNLGQGSFAHNRAFADIRGTPCPVLPDFLRAFVTRFPEHRETVKELLDMALSEIASDAELEQMLAGAIPDVGGRHQERDLRPRDDSYVPSRVGVDPATCTRAPPGVITPAASATAGASAGPGRVMGH